MRKPRNVRFRLGDIASRLWPCWDDFEESVWRILKDDDESLKVVTDEDERNRELLEWLGFDFFSVLEAFKKEIDDMVDIRVTEELALAKMDKETEANASKPDNSEELKAGSLLKKALNYGPGHYKGGIHPSEFIASKNLPFFEGCAVKYTVRHTKKDGAFDIVKAIHYLVMILANTYGVSDDKLADCLQRLDAAAKVNGGGE